MSVKERIKNSLIGGFYMAVLCETAISLNLWADMRLHSAHVLVFGFLLGSLMGYYLWISPRVLLLFSMLTCLFRIVFGHKDRLGYDLAELFPISPDAAFQIYQIICVTFLIWVGVSAIKSENVKKFIKNQKLK